MIWIGRSARAVLTVVSLVAMAGCGNSSAPEQKTGSAEQPLLGPNCVIQRPYGWHADNGAGGRSCRDDARGVLTLRPGETFTFSGETAISVGSVTVVCHSNGDGMWDETEKSCVPPNGGGGSSGAP